MKRTGRALSKFFKKQHTGKLLYDAGLLAAEPWLAPAMAAQAVRGQGLYTGQGMYTGSGEYLPTTNDLISSKSSMAVVPEFGKTDDDSIIISRREYVSEVFGPDYIPGGATTPGSPVEPFVIQSYPINPGLERTFPWLSQIAQNYDEYEMLQCIFTFKSTTTESSLSQNGQVGTVILATNYNSASPSFKDKATMQRYMGAISSKLTESVLHGVECDPEKLSGSIGEYVRTNPVVANQDIKTYDHGKFQIAVANCSGYFANVSLGELWVSYTVKLRKSKFFTSLGYGITKDIFVSKGGEATTNIMGTNMLSGQQNNLGSSIVSNSNFSQIRITIPANYAGYLKVLFAVEGTGMAAQTQNLGTEGNVKLVRDLYASNVDVSDAPWSHYFTCNANNNLFVVHIRVDIATNGIDNVLVLGFGGFINTTITQSYVDISEYNAISSGLNQGINNSDAPVFVNSSGQIELP